MYFHNLQHVVMASEGTAGTAASITSADFDIRIFNGSFKPDIGQDQDNYARGDFGRAVSIPGARSGIISGMCHMPYSGVLATPPKWSKIVKSFGGVETVHGATGVSWADKASGAIQTYTCFFEDREAGVASPVGSRHSILGAMGSGKLKADGVNQKLYFEFEQKGKYNIDVDVANGSLLALTSPDTAVSEQLKTATVTIFGVSYRISKFELDFGVETTLLENQADTYGTGWLHSYKIGHEPKFSCDIEMGSVSSKDWYTIQAAGTTGSITIATTNYTIKIPKAQVMDRQLGNRNNGVRTYDMNFSAIANDGADATMANESHWEILQGTKT